MRKTICYKTSKDGKFGDLCNSEVQCNNCRATQQEIELSPKKPINGWGDDAVDPEMQDAQDLANYMGELSEGAYCAGWMNNLEYDLWELIIHPEYKDNSAYHCYDLTKLKRLADKAGGWIIFISLEDEEYRLPEDQQPLSGEVFIPMENWLRIYKAYTKQ